jgi:predicted DNA-binding ribbon-helix-helix protein
MHSTVGRSTLIMRNIVVAGRRTSARLEPEMWDALRDIAVRQRLSTSDVIAQIDRERSASSLSAGIRVYVMKFYRSLASSADPTAAAEMRPQ